MQILISTKLGTKKTIGKPGRIIRKTLRGTVPLLRLPEFFPIGINRSVSPYVIAPFNPYNMFGPNGSNNGVFPSMIPAPGSPIGTSPSPGTTMSPRMMGVVPVGSREGNGKGRAGTPPNRSSNISSSSNSNKKNGKPAKFKNKHIVTFQFWKIRNNKDKKVHFGRYCQSRL